MRSKYLCALQPPLFLETFIHLSVVKWLPISINTSKFLRVPIIIINNQFAKRQIRLNLRFSLVTLMLSSSTKVTWRLVRLLLKTKCHDNLFCWNVWLAWCHRRKTERWKNRKASFVILRSKSVEHFWKFLIECNWWTRTFEQRFDAIHNFSKSVSSWMPHFLFTQVNQYWTRTAFGWEIAWELLILLVLVRIFCYLKSSGQCWIRDTVPVFVTDRLSPSYT